MKDGKPSLTANLVASARALYTAMPAPLGVAEDPWAESLVPAWMAIPARALRKAPWASSVVHRAARVMFFGMAQHVALRTRAIDDALRAALARGVRQVVVLGSGLDSRAERLPELADLPVFEVDYPASLQFKVERLATASPSRRTRPASHVAIDFARDSLSQALRTAGFDASIPAFFLWEGVTVYLEVAVIADTIAEVGRLAAPRSRLAVTYATPSDHASPSWWLPVARAMARAVGEPVHGFVATDVIATFLERAGFELVSDESAANWTPRYWPGEPSQPIWERLAIAERLAPRPA